MKKCNVCKLDKTLVDYNKKTNAKDGYCATCRDCSKRRNALWYLNNKSKQIAKAKKNHKIYAKNTKAYLDAYKASRKCTLCPESEAICLDFHHLRDKEFNISQIRRNGVSQQRLDAEIAKCILLCANCHRKVHAGILRVDNSIGRVAD